MGGRTKRQSKRNSQQHWFNCVGNVVNISSMPFKSEVEEHSFPYTHPLHLSVHFFNMLSSFSIQIGCTLRHAYSLTILVNLPLSQLGKGSRLAPHQCLIIGEIAYALL